MIGLIVFFLLFTNHFIAIAQEYSAKEKLDQLNQEIGATAKELSEESIKLQKEWERFVRECKNANPGTKLGEFCREKLFNITLEFYIKQYRLLKSLRDKLAEKLRLTEQLDLGSKEGWYDKIVLNHTIESLEDIQAFFKDFSSKLSRGRRNLLKKALNSEMAMFETRKHIRKYQNKYNFDEEETYIALRQGIIDTHNILQIYKEIFQLLIFLDTQASVNSPTVFIKNVGDPLQQLDRFLQFYSGFSTETQEGEEPEGGIYYDFSEFKR
ncbi:hypothetical protein [Hydrogenivirga sp. 128-5-R1-1]|uniref:hypothetical protein n=1 Tax=Hydrogenivirga sp. 128-5-R1-1 TaxID=392423 RepID=UPI00015F337A|nr:hypothetical protein [Hydrogenivirga sp. 128-5-R1-1]EDP74864.1 hypothetical protein HG1285_13387 [Hydrogenivirga sp. 128-5-R1-1]